MNWKRIVRLLVCLALVCVILVNCSPIRAQATGAEAILLSPVVVNPSIAVTAVLFGLGVMAVASATAAFTKLVDEVTADMVDKGLISSQGVDMYRTDADGAATYLVNQELVEAVREYLWENEVVASDGTISDGYALYNGILLNVPPYVDVTSFPFSCVVASDNGSRIYYKLLLSSSPLYFKTSSALHWKSSSNYYRYEIDDYYKAGTISDDWVYKTYSTQGKDTVYCNTGPNSNYVVWSSYDLLAADGTIVFPGTDLVYDSFGVADGLTAGQIAPQDKTFAEGYSEWASGAKTLPTLRDGVQTDAESAYIALGMGLTQEETMAMTQAAVQSGVGTYEGTGTTADVVTATGLKGWLDTIRLTLVSGFTDLIDGIVSIPSSIVSGITSVLEAIFVPSEDFLTEKVQALRSEFAFADTLITGGQMIGDAFNGFDTSPPIIYIDLGATRGDYDIGGKVPFIDLTWYEEYKPTVDMLLSSFLWVVFIWKLFQKAPGIISGMPGDFVMEGLQQLNMDVYLPMRSQSHEKVRRLNRRSKL